MTGNRTTESFLQEVNIVINKDRLLIALSFSWKCNALLHEKYPYSEFFWFVFSQNAGKYRPEKLRIRTLFTHCIMILLLLTFYGECRANLKEF